MALLEVKNVEKVYIDGEVKTPAVKDVSFAIERGEFVSIMGPSGSGKSTLLHIIGFLDRQTNGQYFFDGKAMDDYSEDGLAHIRNKKMGFIFQSFNLLPRATVLENVKLPLLYSGTKEDLWDDMARKAIESVGLSHRTNHIAAKLSGGEKQRVAIARALVNDPNVIFADEPTGNLDSKSGEQVMEMIKKLHDEGHTVILITHETYTAEYANRIIKLYDGLVESDEKVIRRTNNGNNGHFSK